MMEFIEKQAINLDQEANEKEERPKSPERGRHQGLIISAKSILPVTH